MRDRRVLYTVEEAAHLLGISPSTVHRWAREGELRTIPLSGRMVVPASSLEELLGNPGSASGPPGNHTGEYLNEVSIAGRLVAHPEVRQARTGLHYATLRLAVNRQHPTKDPFHVIVVVFGQKADDTTTLQAGDLIRIDGRLGQREWIADDGTRIGAQRVVADRVSIIEPVTAQEVAS